MTQLPSNIHQIVSQYQLILQMVWNQFNQANQLGAVICYVNLERNPNPRIFHKWDDKINGK